MKIKSENNILIYSMYIQPKTGKGGWEHKSKMDTYRNINTIVHEYIGKDKSMENYVVMICLYTIFQLIFVQSKYINQNTVGA